MDSGVDLDHEDFNDVEQVSPNPSPPTIAKVIKTKIHCRDPNDADSREAIYVDNGSAVSGKIGSFEVTPPLDSRNNPVAAAQSPGGATPDLFKLVELHKSGHGHGTLAAGIIGSRDDNELGGVSFSTPKVKILSARMRLGKHGRVALADGCPIIKRLGTHYPKADAVGVVYMGFAFRKKSAAMKDILAAMVADSSAGNDRVWIAPLQNVPKRMLSYPAAILVKKITAREDDDLIQFETAETLGGTVPVVVGVSSVSFDDAGQSPDLPTSYFNVRTYDKKAKERGFAPLDPRICAISGINRFDGSTDVRDRWYGTKIIVGKSKKNVFDGTPGYVKRDPTHLGVGATTDQIYSGDYVRSGPGENSQGSLRSAGNSVAAAQIAALAGTLRSLFTTATAANIAGLIHASQLPATGVAELDVTDGSNPLLVVPIKSSKGKVLGKVPACIDFGKAILTPDPSRFTYP